MHKKGISKKAHSNKGMVQQTEFRVAPIPSPEDLQKYNQITSGFADRIIKMAEQERIDRNALQNKELQIIEQANKRDFSLKNRSLFISLFVIMMFLFLAGYFGYLGFVKESLWFVGITLAGIIGYLTFQKKQSNQNS